MSFTFSRTGTITHGDVLYVAHQINLDLQELSKTFPQLVSIEEALRLFNSFTTFLINGAVTGLGFTIFDPADANLVHLEYKYEVLYGGDAQSVNPTGSGTGHGGRPVGAVRLPNAARFQAWVTFSDTMKALTIPEQRDIVRGTGWPIPSEGSTFERRFEGGKWQDNGLYARGNIAVQNRVYRRD